MKAERTFFWWAVLVILSIANTGRAANTDAEMLKNGGMEAPFVQGLAQGWVKNCYGENEQQFAEETKDVHGGKSAQRITCTKFFGGGVQFRAGGVAVEKGKPYTLRIWMKGDVKSPVYVGIRKHEAPYTGYLKRHVRVKNEWKPYIIIGEASDSDPECGVYIMFASTGTLLVDDVSLLPGVHEDAVAVARGAPPVQKGNRIYNSGFEAGPEGWTPVGGFTIEDGAAHSGRCCASVGHEGVECRPFHVRTGQRYTLSAWIKADKPNTRVELKFFEWADEGGDQPVPRNQRAARIVAGTEWARCQVTGIALPYMWEDYIARITPSGTIHLDDVQIEEGEATDYKPAHEIEVGAETPTRWCTQGDSIEVTAHVAAPAQNVGLTYTLEDLWSRPLATVSHTATPGTPDRAVFTPEGLGMFRVRVRANDSPATGEVWFGVFPKRDRKPRPDSAFGTHVTATVPETTNTMLASEAMGARWVRLHDFGDFCHWRVVEPEKGKLVWCDDQINDLKTRGFTILANLGHPPLWAGRDDPKRRNNGTWTNAPPRDNAEWENYVFKTVEHYRNRIRHWEVWNEPAGSGFFCGTPEEYAELLKVAYRAIKRADPQAVVLGGCFFPTSEEWTLRVLAKDGLSNMDALAYHVYWRPNMADPMSPGGPAILTRQVERYIEIMKERNAPKPIYMTEGGIQCMPFASWMPPEGYTAPCIEAAAGCVKGMVEMLSAGVVNVCYYYSGGAKGAMPWFSTMANGYYVLLDYDGRPKPTLMAYSAMEMLLGDAKPVKAFTSGDLSVHLFAKGGGTIAVVWSDRARTLPLHDAEALDMMGNPMKTPALNLGEPAFIHAPGLTAAQLEGQLRLHDDQRTGRGLLGR